MRTALLPNPTAAQVLLTLITWCYKPETLVLKSQNNKKNEASDVNVLISEAPIISQAEDNLNCWVLAKT